jgi:putative transposase
MLFFLRYAIRNPLNLKNQAMSQSQPRRDYLRRLPPEHYRGTTYVHWSMTTEFRKQGWLTPESHSQFREILIHVAFRYGLLCPVYCLMPDHLHLLWLGLLPSTDQLNAIKFFRKHTNRILQRHQTSWQKQPHDHVLKEAEQEHNAVERVIDYICRNPERAGLVELGQLSAYPFSGCIFPGYPDVNLWNENYNERLWRSHELLTVNHLFRVDDESTQIDQLT